MARKGKAHNFGELLSLEGKERRGEWLENLGGLLWRRARDEIQGGE